MPQPSKSASSPRRAPGRPRAFDPDAALRAAMLLFWQHGFDATSYTDLTRVTGMSKPTLYATFGDKVELFRKCVVAYAEASTDLYEAALAQPTAREAVQACLQLARGLHPRTAEPAVCFLVQGALTGSADTRELRDELTSLSRLATRKLQKRLDEGKRAGELPPTTNTSALAEFYTAVVTGLSIQANNGAAPRDLQELTTLAMAAWPAAHPASSQTRARPSGRSPERAAPVPRRRPRTP